ncbi:MAG: hypothetical protein GVY14_03585 [Spirochaetes bacterium]|nr:hypothetical protein [Spirochaetota bacterium]
MEEYRFHYRVTPSDLMILSLVSIYRSLPGIINIIFSISMILVAFRFWEEAAWIYRALMLLGIVVFPVLQPAAIYLRSRRIVSRMPEGLEMYIGPEGITISGPNDSNSLAYSELTAVKLVAGMIIIHTKGKQGYALSRQVLGGKAQEVYDLLRRRIPAKG